MNHVILMGRLVADPELKVVGYGIECASFCIAINRAYSKDKEQTADFIPCTAWRKTASFICEYFHKGDMIALNGRLQSQKYTDKDGNNRTVYNVQVDRVEFCGGKSNSGNNNDSGNNQKPNSYNPYSADTSNTNFETVEDDENLPF